MKTLYKNCTLLDGTENMSPQEKMSVLIENDRILSVFPDGSEPDSAEDVIDLNGSYLLPVV